MVEHGIPASITMAQAILESGDGNSTLARESNNHFGIKCHSDWTGERSYHDDDAKGECFRKYSNARQSFEDHSLFLKKNRYASLFELKIDDYKSWAKGLKKCGYATASDYAKRLIDLVENNDLHRLDEEGVKMIKKGKKPTRPGDVEIPEDKVVAEWDRNNDLPPVTVHLNRTISLSDNNIKYIIAKEGDNLEAIATDLEIMPWQVKKYNDLTASDGIEEGQRIYIQPKRSKAKTPWHVVEEGQTMKDISQIYGIKLKKLYQKNNMNTGSQPAVGQKLSLISKVAG